MMEAPDHRTLEEREREVVEEFGLFDDWMDKYEHLIELGKDLPPIPAQYKNEEHLIRGCQSQMWLHGEPKGERVEFSADSEALIAKGLAALLVRVLSGLPAKQIAEAELQFLDEIGLKDHLSPTRANGLLSMVKQMKLYGLAHASHLASQN